MHHRNGTVYAMDLGSAHGTFLNGRRLPPHEPSLWPDGAAVTFGASSRSFVLRMAGEPRLQAISQPGRVDPAGGVARHTLPSTSSTCQPHLAVAAHAASAPQPAVGSAAGRHGANGGIGAADACVHGAAAAAREGELDGEGQGGAALSPARSAVLTLLGEEDAAAEAEVRALVRVRVRVRASVRVHVRARARARVHVHVHVRVRVRVRARAYTRTRVHS
eukprot:6173084-Pleurochrysis_carterae.AAC.1